MGIQQKTTNNNTNNKNKYHGPNKTNKKKIKTMIGSSANAFARGTRVLHGPAARKDVELAMTKWWGKKRPTEGQITRSISAHEQYIIGPWLKTFPQKILRRAPTYIIYPGGAATLTYCSIQWAANATAADDYALRP